MVLRSVVLLGLLFAGIAGFAQEKEKKKTWRPDIPGSIILELGMNVKNGTTPPNFQKGLWGSRTVNIYYQYPIRLFKSGFSLNPGIGLSLERWKFINDYTLANKPDADGSYPMVPASTVIPTTNTTFQGSIEKSQLITNYIEAPIELRWDTNPEDIARSFNICFGARIGYCYDSFTKISYKDDGDYRKIKDKQLHGVNPIRWGLYSRMGMGGFSIFGYMNTSTLFEKDKGPVLTTMNTLTFGISINGF